LNGINGNKDDKITEDDLNEVLDLIDEYINNLKQSKELYEDIIKIVEENLNYDEENNNVRDYIVKLFTELFNSKDKKDYYNSLTDEQKEIIDIYNNFETQEEKDNYYNSLTDEQKQIIDNYNNQENLKSKIINFLNNFIKNRNENSKLNINDIINVNGFLDINQIYKSNVSNKDNKFIISNYKRDDDYWYKDNYSILFYNSLNNEQKQIVDNYNNYNIEQKEYYNTLKNKKNIVDNYNSKETQEEKDEYYNSLNDEQKQLIDNYNNYEIEKQNYYNSLINKKKIVDIYNSKETQEEKDNYYNSLNEKEKEIIDNYNNYEIEKQNYYNNLINKKEIVDTFNSKITDEEKTEYLNSLTQKEISVIIIYIEFDVNKHRYYNDLNEDDKQIIDNYNNKTEEEKEEYYNSLNNEQKEIINNYNNFDREKEIYYNLLINEKEILDTYNNFETEEEKEEYYNSLDNREKRIIDDYYKFDKEKEYYYNYLINEKEILDTYNSKNTEQEKREYYNSLTNREKLIINKYNNYEIEKQNYYNSLVNEKEIIDNYNLIDIKEEKDNYYNSLNEKEKEIIDNYNNYEKEKEEYYNNLNNNEKELIDKMNDIIFVKPKNGYIYKFEDISHNIDPKILEEVFKFTDICSGYLYKIPEDKILNTDDCYIYKELYKINNIGENNDEEIDNNEEKIDNNENDLDVYIPKKIIEIEDEMNTINNIYTENTLDNQFKTDINLNGIKTSPEYTIDNNYLNQELFIFDYDDNNFIRQMKYMNNNNISFKSINYNFNFFDINDDDKREITEIIRNKDGIFNIGNLFLQNILTFNKEIKYIKHNFIEGGIYRLNYKIDNYINQVYFKYENGEFKKIDLLTGKYYDTYNKKNLSYDDIDNFENLNYIEHYEGNIIDSFALNEGYYIKDNKFTKYKNNNYEQLNHNEDIYYDYEFKDIDYNILSNNVFVIRDNNEIIKNNEGEYINYYYDVDNKIIKEIDIKDYYEINNSRNKKVLFVDYENNIINEYEDGYKIDKNYGLYKFMIDENIMKYNNEKYNYFDLNEYIKNILIEIDDLVFEEINIINGDIYELFDEKNIYINNNDVFKKYVGFIEEKKSWKELFLNSNHQNINVNASYNDFKVNDYKINLRIIYDINNLDDLEYIPENIIKHYNIKIGDLYLKYKNYYFNKNKYIIEYDLYKTYNLNNISLISYNDEDKKYYYNYENNNVYIKKSNNSSYYLFKSLYNIDLEIDTYNINNKIIDISTIRDDDIDLIYKNMIEMRTIIIFNDILTRQKNNDNIYDLYMINDYIEIKEYNDIKDKYYKIDDKIYVYIKEFNKFDIPDILIINLTYEEYENERKNNNYYKIQGDIYELKSNYNLEKIEHPTEEQKKKSKILILPINKLFKFRIYNNGSIYTSEIIKIFNYKNLPKLEDEIIEKSIIPLEKINIKDNFDINTKLKTINNLIEIDNLLELDLNNIENGKYYYQNIYENNKKIYYCEKYNNELFLKDIDDGYYKINKINNIIDGRIYYYINGYIKIDDKKDIYINEEEINTIDNLNTINNLNEIEIEKVLCYEENNEIKYDIKKIENLNEINNLHILNDITFEEEIIEKDKLLIIDTLYYIEKVYERPYQYPQFNYDYFYKKIDYMISISSHSDVSLGYFQIKDVSTETTGDTNYIYYINGNHGNNLNSNRITQIYNYDYIYIKSKIKLIPNGNDYITEDPENIDKIYKINKETSTSKENYEELDITKYYKIIDNDNIEQIYKYGLIHNYYEYINNDENIIIDFYNDNNLLTKINNTENNEYYQINKNNDIEQEKYKFYLIKKGIKTEIRNKYTLIKKLNNEILNKIYEFNENNKYNELNNGYYEIKLEENNNIYYYNNRIQNLIINDYYNIIYINDDNTLLNLNRRSIYKYNNNNSFEEIEDNYYNTLKFNNINDGKIYYYNKQEQEGKYYKNIEIGYYKIKKIDNIDDNKIYYYDGFIKIEITNYISIIKTITNINKLIKPLIDNTYYYDNDNFYLYNNNELNKIDYGYYKIEKKDNIEDGNIYYYNYNYIIISNGNYIINDKLIEYEDGIINIYDNGYYIKDIINEDIILHQIYKVKNQICEKIKENYYHLNYYIDNKYYKYNVNKNYEYSKEEIDNDKIKEIKEIIFNNFGENKINTFNYIQKYNVILDFDEENNKIKNKNGIEINEIEGNTNGYKYFVCNNKNKKQLLNQEIIYDNTTIKNNIIQIKNNFYKINDKYYYNDENEFKELINNLNETIKFKLSYNIFTAHELMNYTVLYKNNIVDKSSSFYNLPFYYKDEKIYCKDNDNNICYIYYLNGPSNGIKTGNQFFICYVEKINYDTSNNISNSIQIIYEQKLIQFIQVYNNDNETTYKAIIKQEGIFKLIDDDNIETYYYIDMNNNIQKITLQYSNSLENLITNRFYKINNGEIEDYYYIDNTIIYDTYKITKNIIEKDLNSVKSKKLGINTDEVLNNHFSDINFYSENQGDGFYKIKYYISSISTNYLKLNFGKINDFQYIYCKNDNSIYIKTDDLYGDNSIKFIKVIDLDYIYHYNKNGLGNIIDNIYIRNKDNNTFSILDKSYHIIDLNNEDEIENTIIILDNDIINLYEFDETKEINEQIKKLEDNNFYCIDNKIYEYKDNDLIEHQEIDYIEYNNNIFKINYNENKLELINYNYHYKNYGEFNELEKNYYTYDNKDMVLKEKKINNQEFIILNDLNNDEYYKILNNFYEFKEDKLNEINYIILQNSINNEKDKNILFMNNKYYLIDNLIYYFYNNKLNLVKLNKNEEVIILKSNNTYLYKNKELNYYSYELNKYYYKIELENENWDIGQIPPNITNIIRYNYITPKIYKFINYNLELQDIKNKEIVLYKYKNDYILKYYLPEDITPEEKEEFKNKFKTTNIYKLKYNNEDYYFICIKIDLYNDENIIEIILQKIEISNYLIHYKKENLHQIRELKDNKLNEIIIENKYLFSYEDIIYNIEFFDNIINLENDMNIVNRTNKYKIENNKLIIDNDDGPGITNIILNDIDLLNDVMKINNNKFLLLVDKEEINKHLIITPPKIEENNISYDENIINEVIGNHFIFKGNGNLFQYCYGDSDGILKTIINNEINICDNVDYYFNSNFIGYIDCDIYNYINKNIIINDNYKENIHNYSNHIDAIITGENDNSYGELSGEMYLGSNSCYIDTLNGNLIDEIYIEKGIGLSFDIDYDNEEGEGGYINTEFYTLEMGLSKCKDLNVIFGEKLGFYNNTGQIGIYCNMNDETNIKGNLKNVKLGLSWWIYGIKNNNNIIIKERNNIEKTLDNGYYKLKIFGDSWHIVGKLNGENIEVKNSETLKEYYIEGNLEDFIIKCNDDDNIKWKIKGELNGTYIEFEGDYDTYYPLDGYFEGKIYGTLFLEQGEIIPKCNIIVNSDINCNVNSYITLNGIVKNKQHLDYEFYSIYCLNVNNTTLYNINRIMIIGIIKLNTNNFKNDKKIYIYGEIFGFIDGHIRGYLNYSSKYQGQTTKLYYSEIYGTYLKGYLCGNTNEKYNNYGEEITHYYIDYNNNSNYLNKTYSSYNINNLNIIYNPQILKFKLKDVKILNDKNNKYLNTIFNEEEENNIILYGYVYNVNISTSNKLTYYLEHCKLSFENNNNNNIEEIIDLNSNLIDYYNELSYDKKNFLNNNYININFDKEIKQSIIKFFLSLDNDQQEKLINYIDYNTLINIFKDEYYNSLSPENKIIFNNYYTYDNDQQNYYNNLDDYEKEIIDDYNNFYKLKEFYYNLIDEENKKIIYIYNSKETQEEKDEYYNSLTDEQKEIIDNYNNFNKLKEIYYNDLEEDEKIIIDNYNDYDINQKNYYNSLTDEQKEIIDNYYNYNNLKEKYYNSLNTEKNILEIYLSLPTDEEKKEYYNSLSIKYKLIIDIYIDLSTEDKETYMNLLKSKYQECFDKYNTYLIEIDTNNYNEYINGYIKYLNEFTNEEKELMKEYIFIDTLILLDDNYFSVDIELNKYDDLKFDFNEFKLTKEKSQVYISNNKFLEDNNINIIGKINNIYADGIKNEEFLNILSLITTEKINDIYKYDFNGIIKNSGARNSYLEQINPNDYYYINANIYKYNDEIDINLENKNDYPYKDILINNYELTYLKNKLQPLPFNYEYTFNEEIKKLLNDCNEKYFYCNNQYYYINRYLLNYDINNNPIYNYYITLINNFNNYIHSSLINYKFKEDITEEIKNNFKINNYNKNFYNLNQDKIYDDKLLISYNSYIYNEFNIFNYIEDLKFQNLLQYINQQLISPLQISNLNLLLTNRITNSIYLLKFENYYFVLNQNDTDNIYIIHLNDDEIILYEYKNLTFIKYNPNYDCIYYLFNNFYYKTNNLNYHIYDIKDNEIFIDVNKKLVYKYYNNSLNNIIIWNAKDYYYIVNQYLNCNLSFIQKIENQNILSYEPIDILPYELIYNDGWNLIFNETKPNPLKLFDTYYIKDNNDIITYYIFNGTNEIELFKYDINNINNTTLKDNQIICYKKDDNTYEIYYYLYDNIDKEKKLMNTIYIYNEKKFKDKLKEIINDIIIDDDNIEILYGLSNIQLDQDIDITKTYLEYFTEKILELINQKSLNTNSFIYNLILNFKLVIDTSTLTINSHLTNYYDLTYFYKNLYEYCLVNILIDLRVNTEIYKNIIYSIYNDKAEDKKFSYNENIEFNNTTSTTSNSINFIDYINKYLDFTYKDNIKIIIDRNINYVNCKDYYKELKEILNNLEYQDIDIYNTFENEEYIIYKTEYYNRLIYHSTETTEDKIIIDFDYLNPDINTTSDNKLEIDENEKNNYRKYLICLEYLQAINNYYQSNKNIKDKILDENVYYVLDYIYNNNQEENIIYLLDNIIKNYYVFSDINIYNKIIEEIEDKNNYEVYISNELTTNYKQLDLIKFYSYDIKDLNDLNDEEKIIYYNQYYPYYIINTILNNLPTNEENKEKLIDICNKIIDNNIDTIYNELYNKIWGENNLEIQKEIYMYSFRLMLVKYNISSIHFTNIMNFILDEKYINNEINDQIEETLKIIKSSNNFYFNNIIEYNYLFYNIIIDKFIENYEYYILFNYVYEYLKDEYNYDNNYYSTLYLYLKFIAEIIPEYYKNKTEEEIINDKIFDRFINNINEELLPLLKNIKYGNNIYSIFDIMISNNNKNKDRTLEDNFNNIYIDNQYENIYNNIKEEILEIENREDNKIQKKILQFMNYLYDNEGLTEEEIEETERIFNIYYIYYEMYNKNMLDNLIENDIEIIDYYNQKTDINKEEYYNTLTNEEKQIIDEYKNNIENVENINEYLDNYIGSLNNDKRQIIYGYLYYYTEENKEEYYNKLTEKQKEIIDKYKIYEKYFGENKYKNNITPKKLLLYNNIISNKFSNFENVYNYADFLIWYLINETEYSNILNFFDELYNIENITNLDIEKVKQKIIDYYNNQIININKLIEELNKLKDYIYELIKNLNKEYLRCSWKKEIGHYIIKKVDFLLGDCIIDSMNSEFLHILYETELNINQKRGYDIMIGNIDKLNEYNEEIKPEYNLYIPLQFSFNKYLECSLPLFCLVNSPVKIRIQLNNLKDLIEYDKNGYIEISNKNLNHLDTFIIADYYILDYKDRINISKKRQQILTEQIKYFDDIIINLNNYYKYNKETGEYELKEINDEITEFIQPLKLTTYRQKNNLKHTINLHFDGLCKELYIVIQQENKKNDNNYNIPILNNHFIDYNKYNNDNEFLRQKELYNDDDIYNNHIQFKNITNNIIYNVRYDNDNKEYNVLSEYKDINTKTEWKILEKKINEYNKEKEEENNKNKYINMNPLKSIEIKYNGKEREQNKDIEFFDLIQKYQFHKVCNNNGINIYSFSLYPEDIQPSGTSNLGKVGDLNLELIFNEDVINTLSKDEKIFRIGIYSKQINFLRMLSGIGAPMYM